MSPDMQVPAICPTRSRVPGAPGRALPVRQFTVMAAVLLLAGCAQPNSSVDQIRARGALRVVTLNAPTTYYEGAHGPEGFEYRLAAAFARDLGVTLVVESVRDEEAMRSALAR